MKILKRANEVISATKLIRIKEDIPDENAWDNQNTWYSFEHNATITKMGGIFKWYDHCYGDRNYGASNSLLSRIKKEFNECYKSQRYERGHDFYEIHYYELEKGSAISGFVFAVAICNGGSRDASWNNQFLIVPTKTLKPLEEML